MKLRFPNVAGLRPSRLSRLHESYDTANVSS